MLSVRQPYAQLLVTPTPEDSTIPIKWCENRSWTVDVKRLKPSKHEDDAGYPRIAIHASSTKIQEAIDIVRFEKNELAFSEYNDFDLNLLDRTSMIIGSVRLLAIVSAMDHVTHDEFGPEIDEEAPLRMYRKWRKAVTGVYPKAKPVSYGVPYADTPANGAVYWWFFDRPKTYRNPIACHGRLNLWSYNGHTK